MRSKKKMTMFCVFVFFACLIGVPEIIAETKVLKYSDHDPPSGPRYESLAVWFKEIEKRPQIGIIGAFDYRFLKITGW